MTAPGNPFGNTSVPAQYQAQVLAAATKWGINPAVLAAQLNAESGFNPHSVSSAGAVGIAQFLPSTAKEWGVNPYDVNSAIDGMAKLDAAYLKRYGTWSKALAAYNAGPGAVEKYGGIPPYAETQNYVRKILAAAGGALTGDLAGVAGINITPVADGTPLDVLPKFGPLLADLTNPDWWKRVNVGVTGAMFVAAGIYFMMKKQPGSFAPLREVGKAIKGGTGNAKV